MVQEEAEACWRAATVQMGERGMRMPHGALTLRSDASVTGVGSLPLLCISMRNSFFLQG